MECGQGETAIVFLHGVGARADRWLSALRGGAKQGNHCFAIDFPGHGFASKGGGLDHSSPGLARLVIDVVEALGLEQVILVGTSLGGHVAALTTLLRPDLVAGLVLVGPMGIVPVGAETRGVLAEVVQDTSRSGIAKKLRALVHDPDLVTQTWVREEHLVNNSPGAEASFQALATYFRESIDDDVVGDALRRLPAGTPMSLVWGSADRMVPAELAKTVLECLPEATSYTEIADTGHAPYLEDPKRFNAALSAFVGAIA
jgi:pimeloyl-ACP methyl ester carboxylesterase